MNSSKRPTPPDSNRAILGIALGILAVVALIALWYFVLRRPPQMGADPEVFRTVDALYTAVRNKDTVRLRQCGDQLKVLHATGKLPSSSANYLDAIIARANSGDWDSATRQLYDFMLVQRRAD